MYFWGNDHFAFCYGVAEKKFASYKRAGRPINLACGERKAARVKMAPIALRANLDGKSTGEVASIMSFLKTSMLVDIKLARNNLAHCHPRLAAAVSPTLARNRPSCMAGADIKHHQ